MRGEIRLPDDAGGRVNAAERGAVRGGVGGCGELDWGTIFKLEEIGSQAQLEGRGSIERVSHRTLLEI